MRLVMIDNYDSFTYNLVQLFDEFGIEVRVFRNDEVTVEEIRRARSGLDMHFTRPEGPRSRRDKQGGDRAPWS